MSLRSNLQSSLRWAWTQLTSMKVALFLLLLLAVAAIPGSLIPQRVADPNGVAQFEANNPELFAIYDAFPLQLFDVYSSVWFSAIYILLFISLIGCVLPRIAAHWRAMRGLPPRTPSRLDRMVAHTEVRLENTDATPQQTVEFANTVTSAGERVLKKLGYRTVVFDEGSAHSVSAERGYLRETGNLVFHTALVGLLIAVGIGSGFSYQAQKVVVEGQTMVNSALTFDSFTPGRFYNEEQLVAFGVRLDRFEGVYVSPEAENSAALGKPLDYTAEVTVFEPDGSERAATIEVNHPLRLHDAQVYLLANGYAPTLVVRNPAGEVVFEESVPFIPQDSNLTSLGVVKVADGLAEQVGLRGFFYPSKAELDSGAYTSNFPELINPLLTLDVFVGDLGLDMGVPVSVYELDTTGMRQLTGRAIDVESLELQVGDTVALPEGLGTISLEAVPNYVSFDVHHNPAQTAILVFAVLATAGLLTSLFVPRRRVWLRVTPGDQALTLEYAALARGDDPTLEAAVADVVTAHRKALEH